MLERVVRDWAGSVSYWRADIVVCLHDKQGPGHGKVAKKEKTGGPDKTNPAEGRVKAAKQKLCGCFLMELE